MSIVFYINEHQMQQEISGKQNKRQANLFLINMVLVYAGWKAFAYYVGHSNGFAQEIWSRAIYSLEVAYASATSDVLSFFGENTLSKGNSVIYPVLNKIITVADHCLAIPATVIFIGTILFFKGEWKDKLWFIPLGILFIVIINLIRLVFLCYTFAHFPRPYFDINHSLVYVVITYALIFLLIVWWMKKFAVRRG